MKKSEMDDLLGLSFPIRGLRDSEDKPVFETLSLDEVAELRSDFLFRAFALYQDWQVFGVLPHGGGTLDERASYLQAMKILKEEESAWQSWESEQANR